MFNEDDYGIRYYMHSRELGKHNEPHVHIDVRYEYFGSFSILHGRKLIYIINVNEKVYHFVSNIKVNNPGSVSLLSGDWKPRSRF